MAVSLFSGNVARKLLGIQFLAVLLAGVLFCLKDPFWGASAVYGGLAVWLPNVMFMIFAWRHQAQKPAPGRVAWSFAIGEVLKVIATFTLLVVALVYFKAVLLPLIVTWLSVLVVQILAPAVINNKG
ncbi:F0F1 ATP synthase subunit I [Siccibacter turicensis]|jgi:ATP synthase protein I|uniref:ATP F0F1 synthase subunit I n=1 Tax=Siccibacter turicensis TaxID=357233 RepID=A0A2P8VIH0_9ENTR|nr:F0F1 ATP synthase subunit I [Siccibacter turicensis]MDY0973109.1 F0F1 ATP synthase subunit I [Siccibacter turicensis]PSN07359.1 ATP F0F1 synthase subunit I [Siccibacter turicensis]